MPPLRPRPAPLPLLPLAAAALMLVGVIQLALWVAEAWQKPPTDEEAPTVVLTGNPFVDLARTHPKITEGALAEMTPRQVQLPTLPHNLQFGDPRARNVLVVLSDPACGACRVQVQDVMGRLPEGVKVVMKYVPVRAGQTTAGMVLELARRKGVMADFWPRVQAAEGDLSDTALLAMLERSGVNLEAQRAALTTEAQELSATLEKDLTVAQRLGLTAPSFVLDGFVLDGKVLLPGRVRTYIQRLRAEEPLVQAGDFWLMEK